MAENVGLTWEECRNRYRHWEKWYEDLRQTLGSRFTEICGESFQHQTNTTDNMIALVDKLESVPDFPEVTRAMNHNSLRLGLLSHKPGSPLTVWIDWRGDTGKYHIGLFHYGAEKGIEVTFETVVITIKQYILQLQEIENSETDLREKLRNWSWNRCREHYRRMGVSYEKGLQKVAYRNPERYKQVSQEKVIFTERMLGLIDLLETDSELTNAKKRIGHNWLILGMVEISRRYGMVIEWDSKMEKFQITFNSHKHGDVIEVSLENAVPTIKQYISHLQDIENEQDNHSE